MIGDQKVIERCQPFFDARHSVNIEALCRAFGINYKKLEWQKSQKDVRGILLDFLQQPGAAVLEVPTDRAVNVSTYKELFTALRSKM
jgi:2-succinyl-5-enolpyruvyl-6-hydroxy-3-cyclohexene-1-carboxylate synthase